MMIEKRSPVKTVLLYIVLILLTFITLLPLLWMVSSSFKLSSEVFSFPIKWIPETWHWENFVTIWQKINLATYTMNSFKLSILITLIQLLTSSFAAYGFSKCRFPGRNVLFLAYIATIAIPWQVYMLPQYVMMQRMHLIDTHLSIILLQSFTAFGVFLLRQFYITIPDELLEAHSPSSYKACDGNSYHHELRYSMERLHGPDDLLQQRQTQDDTTRYTALCRTVLR